MAWAIVVLNPYCFKTDSNAQDSTIRDLADKATAGSSTRETREVRTGGPSTPAHPVDELIYCLQETGPGDRRSFDHIWGTRKCCCAMMKGADVRQFSLLFLRKACITVVPCPTGRIVATHLWSMVSLVLKCSSTGFKRFSPFENREKFHSHKIRQGVPHRICIINCRITSLQMSCILQDLRSRYRFGGRPCSGRGPSSKDLQCSEKDS